MEGHAAAFGLFALLPLKPIDIDKVRVWKLESLSPIFDSYSSSGYIRQNGLQMGIGQIEWRSVGRFTSNWHSSRELALARPASRVYPT